MREAVAVSAINNNSLLLVCKVETWIPPGGKPEQGEDDIACILRECGEEIPGAVVTELRPFGIWDAKTPHSGDIIECRIYSGNVSGEFTPGGEVCDARWIHNTELDGCPLSDATRQMVKTLRFLGHLR